MTINQYSDGSVVVHVGAETIQASDVDLLRYYARAGRDGSRPGARRLSRAGLLDVFGGGGSPTTYMVTQFGRDLVREYDAHLARMPRAQEVR